MNATIFPKQERCDIPKRTLRFTTPWLYALTITYPRGHLLKKAAKHKRVRSHEGGGGGRKLAGRWADGRWEAKVDGGYLKVVAASIAKPSADEVGRFHYGLGRHDGRQRNALCSFFCLGKALGNPRGGAQAARAFCQWWDLLCSSQFGVAAFFGPEMVLAPFASLHVGGGCWLVLPPSSVLKWCWLLWLPYVRWPPSWTLKSGAGSLWLPSCGWGAETLGSRSIILPPMDLLNTSASP